MPCKEYRLYRLHAMDIMVDENGQGPALYTKKEESYG